MTEPAFATDHATHSNYEARAAEYDEWYTGEGLFAQRDRPGWADELGGEVLWSGDWIVAARTTW